MGHKVPPEKFCPRAGGVDQARLWGGRVPEFLRRGQEDSRQLKHGWWTQKEEKGLKESCYPSILLYYHYLYFTHEPQFREPKPLASSHTPRVAESRHQWIPHSEPGASSHLSNRPGVTLRKPSNSRMDEL